MSYLRRFPVTYLKIDQSFVGNLHKSNSKDNALCESIITLAHKLDAKVIAEGVETIEQRDWLYVSGCNYVQGYFYFHPISATLLYEVLAAQKASSSSL
jgi:EAL domain-containing protein (putative c-di-GMP-specific phosphodiesterase class I)